MSDFNVGDELKIKSHRRSMRRTLRIIESERKTMTKPKDTAEDFDAFDCSSAFSRPSWWPDDWEWPPKLSNEPELRKSLEPLVEKDDPYSNCKSFEDCCKVLFECNAQMRKFFGTNKKP